MAAKKNECKYCYELEPLLAVHGLPAVNHASLRHPVQRFLHVDYDEVEVNPIYLSRLPS